MSEEQKIPTKEELIAFFAEQVEVKKAQLELQKISTELAVAKAEEMKALAFIAQMTTQQSASQPQPEGTPHTITQEDLDNNPELLEAGLSVGDDIIIPTAAQFADGVPAKKLKKK